MRNVSKAITTAIFALSIAACGKEGGNTKSPGGGGGGGPAVDPSQASEEAKKDFQAVVEQYNRAKGDGSLTAGECDSLSGDFKRVYSKHGKQMVVAYFNAGAVWEECGDAGKAEQIYLQVTRDVPRYDLAYNNLGVIYWNRKQEGRALDMFKKAIEVNPKTRAPRNNLAASLRNKYSASPDQNAFAQAEREIQTVLAVDSENRVAYENLARLYYDRGRLKDKSYLLLAELVVAQALRVLGETGEKSADLFNLKGLLQMQRGAEVEALRSFKAAADVDKNHADANMNIAMIALRFRDYTAAEKALQVALKDSRQKRNIETFLGLGVAQRGLRKYGEAEQSFKKAMEINRGDPRALYNLGILYHEHMATREDLNLDGIKKHYTTAKDYFTKFASGASGKKDFAKDVDDAKSRIGQIDESFRVWAEMAELEKKAKALEEQQKKAEEEERKQLLDAEQRALDAAKKAEEAAKQQSAPPPAAPAAGKGAAAPAAGKGAAGAPPPPAGGAPAAGGAAKGGAPAGAPPKPPK